jgi:hypothetical protein
MSSDAAWEVQKALKAVLCANATLTALLASGAASILDDVPENEKFPYVTIGDIQSLADETYTELGQEHICTINAWTSRTDRAGGTKGYEGRKTARNIIAAIFDALNHKTLSPTGFVNTNMTYQFSDVFRDDADTYHGAIRFRVVTEPA